MLLRYLKLSLLVAVFSDTKEGRLQTYANQAENTIRQQPYITGYIIIPNYER